mgnify:CR=1 FL=1
MTNFHRRILQTGIVLLVFLLLLFFSFEQQKKQSSGTDETAKAPISDTAFKLNTVVTVTLYDPTDEKLLAEAIDLCDKYENLFSRTLPTSELYQLNTRFFFHRKTVFLYLTGDDRTAHYCSLLL